MAKKNGLFTLVIAALFLSPFSVYAENNAEEDTKSAPEAKSEPAATEEKEAYYRRKIEALITTEEDETPQDIDTYIRYMPSRKVEAQSGKVAIIDSNFEYSYEFKAFDRLPIQISLQQDYIGIKNSTVVELPAHLVGLSIGLEATFPFFNFNKTYFRVGLNPSFYGDDWSFPTSRFRMPVQTFLIYQPQESLTLIAGVAVFPDFEDVVLPILGLIYKPNDKLSFNLIPKRPNISYALNDRLTLFAEGGLPVSSEFEVDKDDLKNVILEYDDTRVGVGAKYKFNKFINASVSTGGVFNRRLQYRDSLGKVEIKNGLYTEFRLEARI